MRPSVVNSASAIRHIFASPRSERSAAVAWSTGPSTHRQATNSGVGFEMYPLRYRKFLTVAKPSPPRQSPEAVSMLAAPTMATSHLSKPPIRSPRGHRTRRRPRYNVSNISRPSASVKAGSSPVVVGSPRPILGGRKSGSSYSWACISAVGLKASSPSRPSLRTRSALSISFGKQPCRSKASR